MKVTPYIKDVMAAKICPYCKSKTKTVPQKFIYNTTFNPKRSIICCVNYPKCDSYVGTDDEGITLGRLANKALREAKKQAHEHFDKLWREGYLKRSTAYRKLGEFLDEIPEEYIHIGMFNVDTCNKVIEWAKNKLEYFKSNSNFNNR